MTETQKRIRAYKRALPHMKERVIAVALLLVMSASMLTSVSFAWITLSSSPEVSSLATTIATNGNLEIALSDKDGAGKPPAESTIYDGGQDITKSNLTWGNLVNLSHDSYGLDNLTLRPASLNPLDLKASPVYSVDYGDDGRVAEFLTDFAFSNYTDRKVFEVLQVPQYGVRAVSSVTYKDVAGEQWLIDQLDVIDKAYSAAISSFEYIYDVDKSPVAERYMQSISYFVGLHVDVYLNGSNPSCETDRLNDLIEMADKFRDTMINIGNVIVQIANLYQMQEISDISQYDPYDFNDLINGNLSKYADRITAINYFTKPQGGAYSPWQKTSMAWNQIVDSQNSNSIYSRVKANKVIYWDNDLEIPVNYLCDMNTAELGGYTAQELYAEVQSLNVGTVLGVLKDGTEATICNGAIKDADQLLLSENQKMEVPSSDNIVIAVKYKGIVDTTMKPTIRTNAKTPYLLPVDIQTADTTAGGGTNLKGTPVAAETYAMAVDLWTRTNAASALLILEGKLDTKEEARVDGEGNEIKDGDGNTIYDTVVIGYSGVNRVWDGDEMSQAAAQLPAGSISATQGSGSCYIFYPASPEDQEQSLRLLQAMRVAFVDDKGKLLAEASMNTKHAVENAGRVIVPLELGDKDPITLPDGTTVTKYITPMTQNEPQWITALIYLDGSNLSNSEVLANGAIKGQLNIQFGTTEEGMDPVDDSAVMDDYYLFDAVNTHYDFASYEDANRTIKLQIGITGKTPTKVKGNFISFISTTQGARQDEFAMTQNAETGYWEADVTFAGPGNYQLRSLQVDGVDYALDTSEFVYVTYPGLKVNSLSWNVDNPNVMTAASYFQATINLALSSGSDTFPSVLGIFIGDSGSNVSVPFETTDGRNYTATATFTSSGNYELSYVYIDGMITPLDSSKKLSVNLGLRSRVRISEPVLSGGEDENVLKEVVFDATTGWSFVYTMEKPMTFDVSCDILDDQGNKITGLSGVVLNYSSGSVRDALCAVLTWNNTTKQYEGQFNFKHIGVFQYQDVEIGPANPVTIAEYAPTITSISPNPMEYVAQDEYAPYVYDLTMPEYNRVLQVKLKNAAAANLEVTLTKTQTDGSKVDVIKTVTATSTDEDSNISTFRVEVGNDEVNGEGRWDITGVKASNVFYDGKFYSGGENVLDLTDEVVADGIGTYFLTKATVMAEALPSSFSGTFMQAHTYSGAAVKVVDYEGTPLAQVFNKLGIKDGIAVEMTYTWDGASGYAISGTATDASKEPAKILGGKLTASSDGKYPLGDMTFALAGNYSPTVNVTIGTQSYSASTTGVTFEEGMSKKVTVNWTAPSVTVSSISPSGSHNSVYYYWNSLFSNGYKQVTAKSEIVDQNHTAIVYFEGKKTSYYTTKGTHPQVTLTLANKGSASGATMAFTDDDGGDITMYEGANHTTQTDKFVWGTGTTCKRYIGYYDGGKLTIITPAGTLKSNQVALIYNGVNYTFTLSYYIQIVNNNAG